MNKKQLLAYLQNDKIHFIECDKEWCNAYGYDKSKMKEDTISCIKELQQNQDNLIKYLEDMIEQYGRERYVADLHYVFDLNEIIKERLQNILERVKNNDWD